MSRADLGSVGSWQVDGLLFGPLCVAAGFAVAQTAIYAEDRELLNGQGLRGMVSLAVASAAVGGVLAAPLWAIARATWNRGRGWALALGPVVGGSAALAAFMLFSRLVSNGSVWPGLPLSAVLWLAGALLLGPPSVPAVSYPGGRPL